MRKIYTSLLLVLLIVAFCFNRAEAQYGITGTVPGYGPELPSVCSELVKRNVLFFKTGTNAGLYQCVVTSWTPVAAGGAGIGDAVTGGTAHQVLYTDASGNLAGSPNFTFNAANNQLKLISTDGTSAPLYIRMNPAQNIKPIRIFNSAESTEYFYLTQFGGVYSRGGLTLTTIAGQMLMETYNADNSTRFFAVNATDIPLIVKLAASQTADAFQIQTNGSTTPIFKVNSAGLATGTGFAISDTGGAYKGYGNVNVGLVNPFTGYVVIGQNDYGLTLHGGSNALPISMKVADVENARVDANATAGNTRFMIYDVDNATLERVSVGAADSCGTGFKCLRIPN